MENHLIHVYLDEWESMSVSIFEQIQLRRMFTVSSLRPSPDAIMHFVKASIKAKGEKFVHFLTNSDYRKADAFLETGDKVWEFSRIPRWLERKFKHNFSACSTTKTLEITWNLWSRIYEPVLTSKSILVTSEKQYRTLNFWKTNWKRRQSIKRYSYCCL